MPRKTKNIISIIIILLVCGSIAFTGYLSTKSSNSNNSNNMPNMSQNGNQPPEMPNGDNQGEPPEKPEGEMNGEPGNSNPNMEEPPEKPDEDNNMGRPPDMPNNSGGMEQMGEQENNTDNNYVYLILFGIESLSLSLILLYLIMSGFNAHKVFINGNKVVIYILANIIFTVILTFVLTTFANKIFVKELDDSNVEYSSTEDLHLNMSNWSYDSTNNIYYQLGIVYVSDPATKEYESMGIYVPGDYMDCSKDNDKYSCTINKTNEVSDYTSLTAPIVMPINTAGYSAQKAPTNYSYNDISSYMKAGFIYVYAGARGRNNGTDFSGGAPWGVTDFKAAIRYLRYNDNNIAGDGESIFVFGHSGGGAQSTILGTSGDSELYTDYLNEIGALMKDDDGNDLSDVIKGVMAWCPITNLDVADEAYEWNMGQYMTSGTRSSSTWTSALSKDLALAYANYINELKLTDDNGNILSLTKTSNGIYTSGTYYDYLKSVIEKSLTNYLNDNYTREEEKEDYASKYSWVTYNKNTQSVTIDSIEDFVLEFKKATKDVGAFDDLKRSQAENYVFGNSESDALHFDSIMSEILNNIDYSTYDDYDSSYATEYKEDLSNKDDLGNESIIRQNMYNPMYFLSSYYDGYKSSKVAENFRIRTGITQGDTALTTEMNLALALKSYGSINVDFETVWNQGHTMAERTGNSTTNFIDWINEIMKNN